MWKAAIRFSSNNKTRSDYFVVYKIRFYFEIISDTHSIDLIKRILPNTNRTKFTKCLLFCLILLTIFLWVRIHSRVKFSRIFFSNWKLRVKIIVGQLQCDIHYREIVLSRTIRKNFTLKWTRALRTKIQIQLIDNFSRSILEFFRFSSRIFEKYDYTLELCKIVYDFDRNLQIKKFHKSRIPELVSSAVNSKTNKKLTFDVTQSEEYRGQRTAQFITVSIGFVSRKQACFEEGRINLKGV